MYISSYAPNGSTYMGIGVLSADVTKNNFIVANYPYAGGWTNMFAFTQSWNGQVSTVEAYKGLLSGYDTAATANLQGNWHIAAVPEPETYAMMLAGLGLVGFAARRRKPA